MEGRRKALKIARFIISQKAKKPLLLELKKVSNVFDYFVICSVASQRQARALYEDVLKFSKISKIRVHHAQDDETARWFVVDYFDSVLHILSEEAREFYNIERLWKEAKRIPITEK